MAAVMQDEVMDDSHKKKRKQFTLDRKLEMLAALDNGMTRKDVSLNYGISQSTLTALVKDRARIEEKAKAKEVALSLGHITFRASPGWLCRFRRRYRIAAKIDWEENPAPNAESIQGQRFVLSDIVSAYNPKDVFSAGEAGIFYRLLPYHVFPLRNDTYGKTSKQILTVLLCCNALGTEKRRPLVIGASLQPESLMSVAHLPCDYNASEQALMTQEIFSDWLRELDSDMQQQKRRILLLVDECSAHRHLPWLENVRVEFVPSDPTSVFQPQNTGIFRWLKAYYRKTVLRKMWLNLACNKISHDFTVKDAIETIAAAWDAIEGTSIVKCWKQARIFQRDRCFQGERPDVTESSEDPAISELWASMCFDPELTFNDFVAVDDNLIVTSALNDSESEELVSPNDVNDSVEGEAAGFEQLKMMTFADAMDALEKMKSFLCSSPLADDKTYRNTMDKMKLDLDMIQRFLFWALVSAVADGVLGPILGLVFNISKLGIFLSLVLIFCGLEYLYSLQKVSPCNKAVLITGCDSGFGLDLAVHLHKMGFLVFAGCLHKDSAPKRGRGRQFDNNGAERLSKLGGIHVLQMDVTSDEQVKKAVDYVSTNLPANRLFWGVVNNAGIANFGDVEFTSLESYHRLTEVNLWGTVRVTQAFLPLIRKSKGRVVNMASGLARMCVPFRSSYAITKYGIEAFSDSLRYEMRRFGVDVSVIEPGNFVAATGIFTESGITDAAKALWDSAPSEIRTAYGEGYYNFRVNAMKSYTTGTSIQDKLEVVEAYMKALTDYKPSPRYQPMDWPTGIFTESGITDAAKALWDSAPSEIRTAYGEGYYNFRVNAMKSYTTGTQLRMHFRDCLMFGRGSIVGYLTATKLRCFVATHLPEFVYEFFFVTQQQ
ncbi:unnamed protein product [Notodromas monacha]|uniref:HTH psq-type domain-containing protein n=1 Tax=Notodromas monacha TaxID=399045 RepID=A0A7R9BJP5_9CRUS|nr:unnamed protein product [Notodromas monacha]CAG0915918.1 unnamed protein product [Notodromas monacha]